MIIVRKSTFYCKAYLELKFEETFSNFYGENTISEKLYKSENKA